MSPVNPQCKYAGTFSCSAAMMFVPDDDRAAFSHWEAEKEI